MERMRDKGDQESGIKEGVTKGIGKGRHVHKEQVCVFSF